MREKGGLVPNVNLTHSVWFCLYIRGIEGSETEQSTEQTGNESTTEYSGLGWVEQDGKK